MMKSHADKNKVNQSKSNASKAQKVENQHSQEPVSQFVDNRPETIQKMQLQELAKNNPKVHQLKSIQELANNSPRTKQLRAIQELANNSPKAKQAAQLQEMANERAKQQIIQKKENNTGLPDNLKAGVENLSGHAMDDVKVHYNSDKPSQLNAHAYAQGTNIHLASGQEKHLPHETWHVAQQKQGRVQANTQVKGVGVNDNAGLEKEADTMGSKAMQMKTVDPASPTDNNKQNNNSGLTDNEPKAVTQQKSIGNVVQRLEGDDAHELPALFAIGNLQFTSKGGGRTPTFYFDSGAATGRLRTDHGNGPKIYVDAARRTHFFFPSDSERQTFIDNLAAGQKVSEQEGTPTDRTPGYFHYEAPIVNDKKAGIAHKSGGALVSE